MNPSKFSISLLSPLAGEVGDTAASHSGALALSNTVVDASDATAAVVNAFSGSISVVGAGSYSFGPSNVGVGKPYQIESSGEQFAIAMEDMAGQTGSDSDYNDRVWLMMVRQIGSEAVVHNSTTVWSAGPHGTASVELTVTENAPGYEGRFFWNYHVTNEDFYPPEGLSQFALQVPETGGLSDISSNLGWQSAIEPSLSGPYTLRWQATTISQRMTMSEMGDFSFTTPVCGIEDSTGALRAESLTPPTPPVPGPPGTPGAQTEPVAPSGAAKAPALVIRSVTLWGEPGSAPSSMGALFGGMSGTMLGANPNVGGGKRIFPEQPKYQPTTVYDKVSVRVEMSNTVSSDEPVRLKQYDVDDPSSSALPLDDESKNIDNRGLIGAVDTFILTIPTGGNYAAVVRPLSVRPGDNYRFAATINPTITLTDNVKPRVSSSQPPSYSDGWSAVYHDAGQGDPVAESNALTVQSELLTVWRTLHVERDHMENPPGAEVFGGATDDVSPGGALADADIGWAQTQYRKAYIELADDLAAHNPRTETAWNRNVEVAEFDTVASTTRDVSPTNASAFWVMHLISAYEGPEDLDGDGAVAEDTLLGRTNPATATSMTYSESIRDVAAFYDANFDGSGPDPNDAAQTTRYNVFHESLHVFNLPHGIAINNVGPFAPSAATLGYPADNYMHPIHNNKIRAKDVPNNTPT